MVDRLAGLWALGGPFFWVLLLLQAMAVLLFVERLIFLHRAKVSRSEFLGGILNLVEKGRVIEALTVCEENPAPLSRVVRAGLLAFKNPAQDCQTQMKAAAWEQIPSIERRVQTIDWIARIAPLLGLLGTLLSITLSFLEMRAAGAFPGNDMLFGSLGQALVSSCAGLLVALLAYTASFILHAKLDALVGDLEAGSSEFLAGIDKFDVRDAPSASE